MIAYQKEGKSYVVMTNSEGKALKVRMDGLDKPVASGIDGEPSRDRFEVVTELAGKVKHKQFTILQMDRLNQTRAVVLLKRGGFGESNQLCTVELP
jgi:hypothetical protein